MEVSLGYENKFALVSEEKETVVKMKRLFELRTCWPHSFVIKVVHCFAIRPLILVSFLITISYSLNDTDFFFSLSPFNESDRRTVLETKMLTILRVSYFKASIGRTNHRKKIDLKDLQIRYFTISQSIFKMKTEPIISNASQPKEPRSLRYTVFLQYRPHVRVATFEA